MKQETPMLKTNGSTAARELYSNDAGSLIILPSRNYADRVPYGICRFSIWYRFAGMHKPGIAVPLTDKSELRIKELL